MFSFGGIFVGSIVLGKLLGLAAAALLRSRWYHGEVNLETGLMLLLGYASYMAGAAAGGLCEIAVRFLAGFESMPVCSCCC
jgi:H+/Cl- antiporter ClcA